MIISRVLFNIIHEYPEHYLEYQVIGRFKALRVAFFILITAHILLLQPVRGAELLEEIIVVGTTPGPGLGQEINKIPFAVQTASFTDLESAQSLDLADFMNQNLASININSAQNNPLQTDIQFRGFTTSPLLGLPQGIAVYQNGVRVNEPLGDAVNWDLLPESAVSSMDLISGADPLFGLNTLGGAVVVNMKNGFNFRGHQAEVSGGSWDRITGTLESGGNNGTWGYYANISYFEESGWRDLSDSDSLNFYGSLGWRNAEISRINLNLQHGGSFLTGNGSSPAGLLAMDREAVFTAPDITENDMNMIAMDASHFITPAVQLAGSIFWRGNDTDSFNGDASEFELCNYAGGGQSLFEEADAIENALEDSLGIVLDDICTGGTPAITDFDGLEDLIEAQALLNGLDPEDFELEDSIGGLSGTGVLSDAAINNFSRRGQDSWGVDGKTIFLHDVFGRGNRLAAGFSYFLGTSDFHSKMELSGLDPVTRSTQGLGSGTYVDAAATSADMETETWSLYFTDTIEINERLAVTLGGRYNNSAVRLRDISGDRPELNGSHGYSRFNPLAGFTYATAANMHIFGSYSESSRIPTPIELACNEGVFELARQFAIADGDDPEDIEFECRLPNAFLADPPLDDVVTRSFEIGLRGGYAGINYHAGFFRAVNSDDIIFQTTGRATGLFANVDETRRTGIELALNGSSNRLDWGLSYSHVQATFEDEFEVLSPNHPAADAAGVIHVSSGDRIPAIPDHLFKLGGVYRFKDNLHAGMEIIYNSGQSVRGDESNELDTLDGFTVMNLRAGYHYRDWLTLFIRITNVLDAEYENFGLLGEDPTEVLNNLADTSPLYLGAGSPRAVWAGVRVKLRDHD